jgi:two-component system chemotaxis sensor kinase CheA
MNTLANKKLLIVDDEDSNLFALKSYLETLDMKISVVKNGEEAIAFLSHEMKPDAILLDMMMPVMDGYETLKVLNETGLLGHIPVIAVTARAMKGDREKCLKAGAWDYISKPLDMNALVEKMNQWIR